MPAPLRLKGLPASAGFAAGLLWQPPKTTVGYRRRQTQTEELAALDAAIIGAIAETGGDGILIADDRHSPAEGLAECLLRISTDPSLQHSLALAARRNLLRFSHEALLNQMREMLENTTRED